MQNRLQDHQKQTAEFISKHTGFLVEYKFPTGQYSKVEALSTPKILILSWYSWGIVNNPLLVNANVKRYSTMILAVHICSAQWAINIPVICSAPQSQVFTWLRGPQTLKWEVGARGDRVPLLPLHPNMDAPASTFGCAVAALDVGAHATPSHLTWSVVACLNPAPHPRPQAWVRPGCWVLGGCVGQ